MKLRVMYMVHSIPKYEKSGTPVAAWRISNRLKDNNKIDVGFIIPTPDGKVGKEIVDDIPIYRVKKIDFHENFFHDDKINREEYLKQLEEAINEFEPDILHIYNFVFGSYQTLVLKEKFKKLKIIRSTTHTEDICFCVDPMINNCGKMEYCNGPKAIMKCAQHYNMIYNGNNYDELVKYISKHLIYIEDLQNRYVDKFIFTTEPFAKHILKYLDIPNNKIEIVPHGIDKYEKFNFRDNNKNFCFIGGTNERKGLDVLIKAIEESGDILEKYSLNIIGNISENEIASKLKKLKKQYNEKINILGVVSEEEKNKLMQQADFVILPTYFETYNIVLREVLYFDTPVITTKTFGSDIIEDNVNGFKINIGDYNELGKLLYKIAFDDKFLERLQEGAKNTYIDVLDNECSNILNIYKNTVL